MTQQGEQPQKKLAERREWLKRWKEGESAAQIAASIRRDLRTVRDAIEKLRAEEEDRQIRYEYRRKTFEEHQRLLLQVPSKLQKMAAATNNPEIDKKPVFDLALKEAVLGPFTVRWPRPGSEGATLPGETDLSWRLLREHVPAHALWQALEAWRQKAIYLAPQQVAIAKLVVARLTEATGLEAKRDVDSVAHVEQAGASSVYDAVLSAASENGSLDRLAGRIILDRTRKTISVDRTQLLVGGPAAKSSSVLNKIREAVVGIEDTDEFSKLRGAFGAYREKRGAVREVAELMVITAYVGGRCKACSLEEATVQTKKRSPR